MIKGFCPLQSTAPICVGSGLLALDLVVVGNNRTRPNYSCAGGSCGNVLTILAYLGWHSFPVAHLRNDRTASTLLADLHRWQVDTRFVQRKSDGVTPVIVHRILSGCSENDHRFEWKHPVSGAPLPRHRPVPSTLAEHFAADIPFSQVYYFDRAEPGCLILAKQLRERGALIFFEPSAVQDSEVFSACLNLADVIKYSTARLPNNYLIEQAQPLLKIETCGERGLRFKQRSSINTEPSEWHTLSALPIGDCRDTAGAGDWCSAGILDALGRAGRSGLESSSEKTVRAALRRGQALASINCQFEGARGGMYQMRHSAFDELASSYLGCI